MVDHVECNWFPTEESKEKSRKCQKICKIDSTQTFCTVCKRTIKEIAERGKSFDAYG
jgi:predicted Fe-S protein YdhL (DUF1289 family)